MGLFSNNTKELKSKKEYSKAMCATQLQKELEKIMSIFLNSQNQYENITEDMIAFSKKLTPKLDPNETAQLSILTENLCDLHEDYLTVMRMVSSISEKQAFIIKNADILDK